VRITSDTGCAGRGTGESCFRQAVEVSRRQQAKSLARRDELESIVAEAGEDRRSQTFYGWFTEGFDTADLKEAKALLEELT
jgi:hypothetical protein